MASLDHEKEQQRLDDLSKRGIHLVRPRLFRGWFTRDPTARYVYRLDFQPMVKRNDSLQEYRELYEDAGWEHVGQCMNWHYFRRPWGVGKNLDIYTDKGSLKQHYRRIRRLLGGTLLVEISVLLVNLFTMQTQSRDADPRIAQSPLILFLLLVIILLAYGFLVMQRRIKQIEGIEKA